MDWQHLCCSNKKFFGNFSGNFVTGVGAGAGPRGGGGETLKAG